MAGEKFMEPDQSQSTGAPEQAGVTPMQPQSASSPTEEPQKETEATIQEAVSPGPLPIPPATNGRVEVSAQTVTRMMGIASTTDLKLLEGRVDLLTSKVSSLLIKVDRMLTMFGSIPTPSDIGRLEIQLGSIKSMVREALEALGSEADAGRGAVPTEASEEQSRKLREGIRSSAEAKTEE